MEDESQIQDIHEMYSNATMTNETRKNNEKHVSK